MKPLFVLFVLVPVLGAPGCGVLENRDRRLPCRETGQDGPYFHDEAPHIHAAASMPAISDGPHVLLMPDADAYHGPDLPGEGPFEEMPDPGE